MLFTDSPLHWIVQVELVQFSAGLNRCHDCPQHILKSFLGHPVWNMMAKRLQTSAGAVANYAPVMIPIAATATAAMPAAPRPSGLAVPSIPEGKQFVSQPQSAAEERPAVAGTRWAALQSCALLPAVGCCSWSPG